jgi:hypothetical protein
LIDTRLANPRINPSDIRNLLQSAALSQKIARLSLGASITNEVPAQTQADPDVDLGLLTPDESDTLQVLRLVWVIDLGPEGGWRGGKAANPQFHNYSWNNNSWFRLNAPQQRALPASTHPSSGCVPGERVSLRAFLAWVDAWSQAAGEPTSGVDYSMFSSEVNLVQGGREAAVLRWEW